MARGVNNVIPEVCAYLYEAELMSMPAIAKELGTNYSAVRTALQKAGVPLRTRAQGVRLSPDLGVATRGKTRHFSREWRKNISRSRRAHGEKHARNISRKPNGYVEITRGPNKGRGVHRVTMEAILGRELRDDEVVHHVDGDPTNNDPSNLKIMSRADHLRLHRKSDANKSGRDAKGRFKGKEKKKHG